MKIFFKLFIRWLKFGEYYYPCGMNKFHLLPENWEEE